MNPITEKTLESFDFSARQLAFFAINCCYEQIWNLIPKKASFAVIDAELFADGLCGINQLITSKNDACHCWESFEPYLNYSKVDTIASYATQAAIRASQIFIAYRANNLDDIILKRRISVDAACYCRCALSASQEFIDFQYTILNDLVRPKNVTFLNNPTIFLNNPAIRILAKEIYQNKSWDLIPVLCDLLIDCDFDDRFIEHLKEPYHRRGCWVLEMLK